MNRWGIALEWLGGVYLHKMKAQDAGVSLHSHEWDFITLPLWGGYEETRARILTPEERLTKYSGKKHGPVCHEVRKPLRPRRMKVTHCHRATKLRRTTCWTIIIRGPKRGEWGMFTQEVKHQWPVYAQGAARGPGTPGASPAGGKAPTVGLLRRPGTTAPSTKPKTLTALPGMGGAVILRRPTAVQPYPAPETFANKFSA